MPRSVFSDAYSVLVSRLVAARNAAGVTQVELARRLGKPQSFVSKIERGERRLDAVELVIVARALGTDALKLLSSVENSLPPDARL